MGDENQTPRSAAIHFTTISRWAQILVWLGWFLVLLILAFSSHLAPESSWSIRPPSLWNQTTLLAGLATHDHRRSPLFPWSPQGRWRKRVLRRWRVMRTAYRRVRWAAHLARVALRGAFPLATLVDLMTH